ncbi:MAG: stage II sporulation protein M [Lachnospiraceae bacterium]|nr:stage II sporulation protein M [Lachnospiraceae bacterium]
MKKSTYLFFFVFLAGVIWANILGMASGKDLGAMNAYFMNRYMYADIQGRELFLYLFYERVPEILILFILSIGIYGTIVVNGYICYVGFSVGFLFVISIMNYGISGIALMFGFFFPQWLFYVPMIGIWHYALHTFKNKEKNMYRNLGYLYQRIGDSPKKQYIKYMVYFIIAFALLFGGILLESYVNPYILQRIIRML